MIVQVDGLQDDDGQLQRLPYGVYARQGLLSNFFTQLGSVVTLYSYSTTVTVPTTVTVVTTCIPTNSFITKPPNVADAPSETLTTPCARRRRREILDVPEQHESISPSNVEQ